VTRWKVSRAEGDAAVIVAAAARDIAVRDRELVLRAYLVALDRGDEQSADLIARAKPSPDSRRLVLLLPLRRPIWQGRLRHPAG
jgi:hypothetical protein